MKGEADAVMNGGAHVAEALKSWGVPQIFTLCGGHISPILVEAEKRGIAVVDVRDEVSAVFAADAAARLTGIPGVAAVTAGPGVTNTVTAVKNAQMAQSPVLVIGGATPTVLKGRGSLQDIEQVRLMRSLVKGTYSVSRVRDLGPAVHKALALATSGVPGPVFLECPVDTLYGEKLIRGWYAEKTEGEAKSLADLAQKTYLKWHLDRLFAGSDRSPRPAPSRAEPPAPGEAELAEAARALAGAERPLLVLGSQTVVEAARAEEVARAVESLGIPVYLAGMSRGLLGHSPELQLRHKRRKALREADVVLLSGFPADFRLDYGGSIPRRATLIGANRSRDDLRLNRKPDIGLEADPGRVLIELAKRVSPKDGWKIWRESLRRRDADRDAEIAAQARDEPAGEAASGGEAGQGRVNPLALCRAIEAALPDDSVLVVDGGDFVATASYVIRPRGPLRWLDPGAFGTLGVGGGFALGAKLSRPSAEVWLLYGDGSAGYSLAEIDTFVRHGLSVIAVVGNDAGWTQIAREQVEILGSDVAVTLRHSAYHTVAEGYGGVGLLLDDPARTEEVIAEARRIAAEGKPVVINAILAPTDFRKGSISM